MRLTEVTFNTPLDSRNPNMQTFANMVFNDRLTVRSARIVNAGGRLSLAMPNLQRRERVPSTSNVRTWVDVFHPIAGDIRYKLGQELIRLWLDARAHPQWKKTRHLEVVRGRSGRWMMGNPGCEREETPPIDVTGVSMYRLPRQSSSPETPLVAALSVALDDSYRLNGIQLFVEPRIHPSPNGDPMHVVLQMPSRVDSHGVRHDIVHPTVEALRSMLVQRAYIVWNLLAQSQQQDDLEVTFHRGHIIDQSPIPSTVPRYDWRQYS